LKRFHWLLNTVNTASLPSMILRSFAGGDRAYGHAEQASDPLGNLTAYVVPKEVRICKACRSRPMISEQRIRYAPLRRHEILIGKQSVVTEKKRDDMQVSLNERHPTAYASEKKRSAG
jgi:hypothetical protein